MDIENTFVSDDILLASFLITNGINLIDVVEDYGGHFIFKLSNRNRCSELKSSYLNNAPAPARQLFSTREMLISEIKNRHKNGEKYEAR